ncbi:MAG: DinB superfamily protein [Bacteroidota bacterium]
MNNVSKELKKLFVRDLNKLMEEINAYSDEASLWMKQGNIKNSAGNLVMHICGNLQYYIGTTLAGTDYIRDRSFEFEGKMKIHQLHDEIDKTLEVIKFFFESSTEELYEKNYPVEVFGFHMSTFYFIIHLQGHLNYHLGQINYHRRILSK